MVSSLLNSAEMVWLSVVFMPSVTAEKAHEVNYYIENKSLFLFSVVSGFSNGVALIEKVD